MNRFDKLENVTKKYNETRKEEVPLWITIINRI
jgi:hypothetical protein